MAEVHAFPSIPTKIVLPIDFSPSSQVALEMAVDLAQHFHAELFLLNVIPMFPTTSLPDMIPEANFIQQAREYSTRHLAKCQAVLVARGIKATPSVEVGNDVAGNVMEVIERAYRHGRNLNTRHLRLAPAVIRLNRREGCQAGGMSAVTSSLSQA